MHNFAATSIWGGAFFRIAMGATPFLLPLLFQIGFGMTAFDAGLLMLAYAGGNLVMKAATTPILRRFGFRRVLVINGVLVTLTTLACAFLAPGLPFAALVAVLAVAGLARSLQFTALNTLAFADIPPSSMGNASTMHAMVQQVAFAFGIAFGAVILSLSAALRGGVGGPFSVADFQITFIGSAIMTVAAMPSLVRLADNAGDEVSGYSVRSSNRQ